MTPLERFAVESPLVRPGQPFSPGVPEAEGMREAWLLDSRVPQKHFGFRDFEAISGHFRGVPLAGAAHIAAIKAVSRRVAMEGFFTKRICFATV